MTAPSKVSITYGHGLLDDCTNDTVGNWNEVENGQTLEDLVVLKDDVFDAECSGSTGPSATGYWDYAISPALSSLVFTKCRWRVKCSNASIKVGITLVFDDATVQDILLPTNYTTWKAGVGTVTPASGHPNINHVRFWVNAATGHVYVDFILIYKGEFTLPNTAHELTFTPSGRFGLMEPVGMSGAQTQNLGSELATVKVVCDRDIGTWTRGGDVINGEVFLDIEHNSKTEDFQWITLGDLIVQFKATLLTPQFSETSHESTATHELNLEIREYRRGDASDETYAERYGLT